MNGPKKKAVKKTVRKVEEELDVDPDSTLGGIVAEGIASLFGDDDDDKDDDDSSDSIFGGGSSDDDSSDDDDFGGGDFGGGGASSDW
jgi:uncharacterized membrane protein YgcG